MGKVADPFPVATGKRDGKDIDGNSDQMKKFVTDAIRGFGTFDAPLGVESFGIARARAAKREIQQRKRAVSRSAWRFHVTLRRPMALASLELGASGQRKEGDSALLLSDFAIASRKNPENYDILGKKMPPRSIQHTTLSAFISAAEQQALFIE